MKTEEKVIQKITDHSPEGLVKGVQMALEVIEELKEKTDWQFKGNLNVDPEYIKFKFQSETLNQRKKLKRRINRLLAKKSMKSANFFLRELHRYLPNEGKSACRFDYSEKEKKIKAARKKYVEARNIAILLYEEYKEEKGDYYRD